MRIVKGREKETKEENKGRGKYWAGKKDGGKERE